MKCCINCFVSNYLKDIVYSFSKDLNNCDYCGTEKIPTCDAKVLEPQLRNFCELYSIAAIGGTLQEQVHEDFPAQIFSFSDPVKTQSILSDIFVDVIDDFKDLFYNPVQLSCKIDPVSIGRADDLKVTWDRFVKEIKNENRYHITNEFDLNKLKDLLKRYEGKHSVGNVFYRARISSDKGFSKTEMGNPPNNMASHGRANPEGISYLYLSNDIQTTLYETRAYLFDFVTIGEFHSVKEIETVKLQVVNDFDPIQLADNDSLADFMIYLPFVSHLAHNLSKPVRRNDNKLEYYPTQYLSEFIKSLGYDGVEYGSSLYPTGYNLAIFNSDVFECRNIYVKEINEIQFSHRAV